MKKIQKILSDGQPIITFYFAENKSNSAIESASIKLKAPAKINLNLNILGKRADNYHELETIMQSIAIFDDLQLKIQKAKGKSQITIQTNIDLAIEPQNNLAYRAAILFLKHFNLSCNLEIELKKNIPMAAGLAGGSTDAATVLLALFYFVQAEQSTEIFQVKLPEITHEDLFLLAEKLGADVPFCLFQGTALCLSKGEIIHPLNDFVNRPLLIYHPPIEVLTKEAFAYIKAKPYQENCSRNQLEAKIAAYAQLLLSENLSALNCFKNDFSEFLFHKHPELAEIFTLFSQSKAEFIRFTGSGPTIFALYASYQERDTAYQFLKDKFSTGKLFSTYTCRRLYQP